jgi:hypothetical protein
VSAVLFFSSVCLVAGGLLLIVHFRSYRRPSLQVRLARAEGELPAGTAGSLVDQVPEPLHKQPRYSS